MYIVLGRAPVLNGSHILEVGIRLKTLLLHVLPTKEYLIPF
jgi:hypothetical protein